MNETGYTVRGVRAKEGAYDTIDNVTKFALTDDDYEEYEEWVEYTEAELAERKAEEEAAAKKTEREAFLESAPERLTAAEECQSEADDALCALYEESLEQQALLSEQDDAICELYELVKGGD